MGEVKPSSCTFVMHLYSSTTVQHTASGPPSKMDKVLEDYVSFSTANLLCMNIEPIKTRPAHAPELNVETHHSFSRHPDQSTVTEFSVSIGVRRDAGQDPMANEGPQGAVAKRKKLLCVSGWFWCKF